MSGVKIFGRNVVCPAVEEDSSSSTISAEATSSSARLKTPVQQHLVLEEPDSPQNKSPSHTRQNGKNGYTNGKASFIYNGQVISMAQPTGSSSRRNDSAHSRRRESWISQAQRIFPKFCFNRNSCQLQFDDDSLEQFYRIYSSKQNILHFLSILIFNLSFAIILVMLTAFSYSDSKIPSLVMISTSLIITSGTLVAYKRNLIAGTTLVALSYLLWLLILLQIFVKLLGSSNLSKHYTGDTTVWLLLLCYFSYIVLPAKRVYCLALSISVNLVHISVLLIHCELGTSCEKEYVQKSQVIGCLFLYAIINILGYMTAYLAEKNQRRSFLEIKESIIGNAFIEEQLLEQEELLISVLPRHIASNMMADIVGKIKHERFRKMYMTRHENVSILFADIVGFTTMSSVKSASEVCSLLNQLFTTFDDLAEKFHQLRIKILGDCYYCISGAPEPRSDHAVLCVHMGLNICEAIKSVRAQSDCDVDMRVGIHTGKVLGGVIGQKQWQYDVMSIEVSVANQMESLGVPGKVHISQAVVDNLGGQFELEKRGKLEGHLIEDMNTYLVKSVLKNYPQGTHDENTTAHEDDDLDSLDDAVEAPKVSTVSDRSTGVNSQLYREMMKKNKTNSVMLEKSKSIALWFADKNLEVSYRQKEIQRCGLNMCALELVLVINFIIYLSVYDITLRTLLPYVIGTLLAIPLRVLSFGSHLATRHSCRSDCLLFLQKIDNQRHIITVIATLITYSAHIVSFYFYAHEDHWTDPNQLNTTNTLSSNTTTELIHHHSGSKPEFFVTGIALTLIATHLLNHIGYIIRVAFMAFMAVSCSLVIILKHRQIFLDPTSESVLLAEYNHISAVAALCGAAFILSCLSFQRDKTSRKLFLSRIESENQRDKIGSLREVNQKLVHNILPPYIATQFLRRRNSRELYSECYENVAVMFIGIPQFQAFYSEEHFNNDGLECIRFLNEIISDFDEVLNDIRFRDISKIKTIGSTYMVACGLDEQKRSSTTHTDRNENFRGLSDFIRRSKIKPMEMEYDTVDAFSLDIDSGLKSASELCPSKKHLVRLIEFALALRDQMDSINEQSFNTFMLQIGMNHGPIIGGVIGARKPHYDIWGNTVNVASRMETTGVPGKIQVTSECEIKLRDLSLYEFKPRGQILVKGKGQLSTYLLDCSPRTENSHLWT